MKQAARPQEFVPERSQQPSSQLGSQQAGASSGTADSFGTVLPPPRLRRPDRQQSLPAMILDDLLEPDHTARLVWAYVESLDLSELYDRIRSRLGGSGHPAADPRVLVALWLYATFRGVSSARRLAELCRHHHAYRWLCGGVEMNYHSLSDFRTDHPDFLERLFRQSIQAL